VYVTRLAQEFFARRGDAPQFLSICHVLEFEPIYREEAKQRQREHGGTAPGKHSVANGDEVLGKGRFTKFMERDSAASEMSVARVLYVKAHDAARFGGRQAPASSTRRSGQRGISWRRTRRS